MDQPTPTLHIAIVIKTDEIDPLPVNVNVQPPDVFASLVETIRTHGFTEPVVVYRKKNARYGLINGEHRWQAARALNMAEVTAVVLPIDEEDAAAILNMRLPIDEEDAAAILNMRWNYTRGRLDPVAFTSEYNRLRQKYDPQTLRRALGIGDEAAFRRLYRDVRATLPPEVQRRLDKTKKEIVTVHDLADAVRTAVARYGRTVDFSLLMFEYSGRVHYVVKMTARAARNVERIAEWCVDHEIDLNEYVVTLLEQDDAVAAALMARVEKGAHDGDAGADHGSGGPGRVVPDETPA